VVRNVAVAVPLLLSACLVRSYEHDSDQINARYALEYRGECSSWLKSPRTGFKYCASPPFHVDAPMPAQLPRPVVDGPIDQASLMANGEKVYGQVCGACHQANGQGTPGTFPPLAGSGAFYGDAQKHAGIIIKGLSGEINVQGVTYNGVMPPQGALSDYDIASVATFERSSWGNNDGLVLPADVKAAR
jgi:mono/diheme cytochrome c family protein